MNQREKKKNDALLAIIFVLLFLANTGVNYNNTGQIHFLYAEIICIILLIITISRYIKIRKDTKQTKRKTVKVSKAKRAITPFDKKFKKNYIKTKSKNTYKEPIPDKKSAYIQSAWDEVGKI